MPSKRKRSTDPSHGAGYVTVRYGDPQIVGGLAPAGHIYHQDTVGIPGSNESDDNFGAALSIGDINGDHRAELAIGVPYEPSAVPKEKAMYSSCAALRAG
ncbi:FG-GAP repeat protein [Streptomyces avermitilis]|uniref:FG-GAP repeat protein n=1 Tax=Streptomyces avermitilis TaxID=33903 RepID=UPI0033ADAF65